MTLTVSDIKIALLIFFIYNYSMRIESVQNKKIKEFVKLHTKKGRDEKNLFIAVRACQFIMHERTEYKVC